MNAVLCFIDFIRMCRNYPNEYMRKDCTEEEWCFFVFDTTPLILRKWGLQDGPN